MANSDENYRLIPVDCSVWTSNQNIQICENGQKYSDVLRNLFCANDVSGKVFKELALRGTGLENSWSSLSEMLPLAT